MLIILMTILCAVWCLLIVCSKVVVVGVSVVYLVSLGSPWLRGVHT